MAKSKNSPSFWTELTSAQLYKRNQGRLWRQLTAAGLGVVLLLGCWTLSQTLQVMEQPEGIRLGIPIAIAVIGSWVIYRLVNFPQFADFLISVEAEMDKVSWASKEELYRATVVVLVTMFSIGVILFCFDRFWMWFFNFIGFLKISAS